MAELDAQFDSASRVFSGSPPQCTLALLSSLDGIGRSVAVRPGGG